ncbi:MAG: hypothetical protein PWR27_1344 [Petroclostridium sp.]|jgi:hypothetical protein|nr:hypothetical protein [Petroclostridium sp.]
MRKKVKKAAVLLLALVLIFTNGAVSFAEADNGNKATVFSLQQAVDYALQHSPLIGISETGLEKATVGLKEANSAYKKADDAPVVAFESKLAKEGYYKRIAEQAFKLAKKSKEQTVESIRFAVESSYFNLLNARENLEIQEKNLELAQKNLELAQKKYELGTISEIEVLSFKTAYLQAEIDRKSALRALEYQRMNFNKTLGLPLQTEVQLTDTLTTQPPAAIELEEKVSQALQERMEVISASEQNEIDNLYFRIVSIWYPQNTYIYQKAKHAAESSEYALANIRQTVELSVRKAYMDMLDAYEMLDVLRQSEEQMAKAYEISRLKYENGMGTNNEVLEAMNNLREIRLKWSQALLGYNLACKNFEISCKVGLSGAASN